MSNGKVAYRQGTHPREGRHPGLGYRAERAHGMIIERDVAVPLRDGVTIYVDLFRPENGSPAPALVAWSPYGKHAPTGYERFYANAGVDPAWVSDLAAFEGPDPAYWVPAGYTVVNVDPRGTWYSEGAARFWGDRQEGLDGYDVVEWIAAQPWCTGKVGFSGVSYLAHIQWRVAAERPPHLAAINPCEGYADAYRESAFHGGIPAHPFTARWQASASYSVGPVEDVEVNAREHPLFDDYWQGKVADLSQIEVPAYIVASWSDQGLHTRGTIGAFNQISSTQKWLEVHGRKKWQTYHSPEWVAKQRCFFDTFLKDVQTEIGAWPHVSLEVRDRYYAGERRAETDWPPVRTDHQMLFLDAANGTLNHDACAEEAYGQYFSSADGGQSYAAYDRHRVHFDHKFAQETELTGAMKLRIWVEAEDADDMDLFVGLQKFDGDGKYVGFPYFGALEDGPVALGWLRVSHRELDDARSTPYQPWHRHAREVKLDPGDVVPVEVEVWPSSTLFHAGEVLRLVIQGSDIYRYGEGIATPTHMTVGGGAQNIHTGGRFDSHLLIPVIPRPTTDDGPARQ